jgi:hypothetical protein
MRGSSGVLRRYAIAGKFNETARYAMKMETNQYAAPMKGNYADEVREKVMALEQKLGQKITHGSEGTCSTCGHDGIYDLKETGLGASSIYYSSPHQKWRCMMCDYEGHI